MTTFENPSFKCIHLSLSRFCPPYAYRSKKAILLISLNTTSKHTAPTVLLENTKISAFSEPLWSGKDSLIYVNTTSGASELWCLNISSHVTDYFNVDAHHLITPGIEVSESSLELVSYKKHRQGQDPTWLLPFPAAPGSVKYIPTSGKKTGFDGILSFSAYVWTSHGVEQTEKLDKAYADRPDDGMVFDELLLREWDTWRIPEKEHQIFLVGVHLSKGSKSPVFTAPFNSSGIVSLMEPFADVDYDITLNQDCSNVNVAVQIKDKHLNYAFHTRRNIYVTSVSTADVSHNGRVSMITKGDQGAVTGLNFSPKGDNLAWLEMRIDGDESDRNRVMSFDFKSRSKTEWTETWDRSPNSVRWAPQGDSLYLLAEDHGSILPYHLTHPGDLPKPLLFNGSASSLQVIGNETLLLASSDLTKPTEDYLLKRNPGISAKGGETLTRLTYWSAHGLHGKELSPGEKFWFKGAENHDVMGWIVKPKGWKKNRLNKYPLAFLIHGGPESAWEDAWSTRWNPNVFAQQGYFVVAINPTGSTGYGQDFVNGIRKNWGGRPFKDLVAGLHHVLDKHPEIDRSRMAALGASYGGYMINWLQGHNSETNFTAFVNHDGLFETVNMYYATEEVYFPQYENGGLTPYEDRFAYEQWNPANFVQEWNTPALIVQGGKDYRVPEYQAISAFTALQRRGVPSRFMYFPSENHWVLNPHNSLRWHHEVFRWLDEWVGESAKRNVRTETLQQQTFMARS